MGKPFKHFKLRCNTIGPASSLECPQSILLPRFGDLESQELVAFAVVHQTIAARITLVHHQKINSSLLDTDVIRV
jgi:hypothetical protein